MATNDTTGAAAASASVAPDDLAPAAAPPAAAVWMADKQSGECVLCFRAFTIMLRRHHCRKCGILVCSKCSSQRIVVEGSGSTKASRVCDGCFSSAATAAAVAAGGPVAEAAQADAAFNAAVGLIDRTALGAAAAATAAASATGAATTGESGGARDDFERVRVQSALADPGLALPSLPSWTYAFLRSGGPVFPAPFSPAVHPVAGAHASALVPVGRLYVKVVCCVNLPAMNSLLNATDAYVTLHCGNPHTSGGAPTQRTRIVTNSLNPRFDAAFHFDVKNAREDVLTLTIFDWDQIGHNKEIAYLQLPLSTLSHSRRLLCWFDLANLSVQASRASNVRAMAKHKVKEALKEKDRSALEEAHQAEVDAAAEAAAGGAASASNSSEVRVARPRIQLELQYLYDDAASLSTHVLPYCSSTAGSAGAGSSSAHAPQPLIKQSAFHPEAPFDIDVLYRDLFRLLDLLHPVTSALGAVWPVLAWQKPWQSLLVLATFVVVVHRPWLFLVLIELLALAALTRALVRRIWADYARRQSDFVRVRREALAARQLAQKKKDNALFRQAHNIANFLSGHEDDAPAAVNAQAQSVLGKLGGMVNPFHSDSSGRPLDAAAQSHLNGLVTHTLNGLLISFGLRGSLVYYQQLLTFTCDAIQSAVDLLSWKDRAATRMVLWGLLAALLYSLLLPQRYIFLAAGCYVLTMNTPPVRAALASVLGAVAFFTTVRSSQTQPPPPPSDKRTAAVVPQSK